MILKPPFIFCNVFLCVLKSPALPESKSSVLLNWPTLFEEKKCPT
uniref:Uncharacterized protein n=1 Tax=Rhizophora mucronata TaxID=61149 RepID=A0A2P2PHI4_RHIMU